MASKKKVYAVKKGRKTGLFQTWDETKAQVDGYPGAIFKGFTTMSDAQAFLAETESTDAPASTGDVIIGYSDGGSRNTGNVKEGHVKATDKAAWAYRLEIGGKVVADTGGEWGATNNRMEIMALVKALEKLITLGENRAEIAMVLDSKYVLDAVTKGWLAGWKRRGWRRSTGELKNAELWQQLDRLLPKFSHMSFSWTKGHADNAGNVYVDELLNKTMDQMTGGAKTTKSVVKTPVQPKKETPTTQSKQKTEPLTPEVKKSVGDLENALSQLNLFTDDDHA